MRGPRHSARLVVAASVLAAAACSLTPIPDLSSQWVEPCDPQLRRCPVDFTLAAGAEKTAELRGTFRDGGWVTGEPMERVSDTWTATVVVPWGDSVQYKFFLDGNLWVLDPANARQVPDGMGNTNSLIENVTCARWTCVKP